MWQAQQIAAIQLAAAATAAANAYQQHTQQQQQMLLAMSAPAAYQLQQRPPQLAMDGNNASDTEEEEDDEQLRTIFCGNLDERVSEELLYEAFLQAGPVESVRIPKDNCGKQRTFGFVTYSHRCSPPYAIQLLAGLALYRRTLIIKCQGESGGSGGGGSRRRSLPSDCERYVPRQRIGDNSMLRSSSYPSFHDSSLQPGTAALPPPGNPFRTDSPDWTKNTAPRNRETDRERTAKHASANTRPHHNSSPYQRGGDSSRHSGDSRDNGHRRGGGEQQRWRQDDNDRRSESHGRQRR